MLYIQQAQRLWLSRKTQRSFGAANARNKKNDNRSRSNSPHKQKKNRSAALERFSNAPGHWCAGRSSISSGSQVHPRAIDTPQSTKKAVSVVKLEASEARCSTDWAVVLPIPELAPVMIATCPSNRSIFYLSKARRNGRRSGARVPSDEDKRELRILTALGTPRFLLCNSKAGRMFRLAFRNALDSVTRLASSAGFQTNRA